MKDFVTLKVTVIVRSSSLECLESSESKELLWHMPTPEEESAPNTKHYYTKHEEQSNESCVTSELIQPMPPKSPAQQIS